MQPANDSVKESIFNIVLKVMMIRWPGRVRKKGREAEYYLEKDGMCRNGSVVFGRELTLKEAREEISSKCKITPDDPRLKIYKLR